MKTRCALLLGLLIFFTAGCSTAWNEGDSGYGASEIGAFMDEAQGGGASGKSSGSDVANALQFRDHAIVYFAEAPGSLGPAASLLSFVDFGFLGSPNVGATSMNLRNARVFFLDAAPNFGLVVGIDQGQGYTYYGFSGQGSVDGDFQAVLSGSAGQITVQSDDVEDGVLTDVIQLHVYDSQGAYLGKFSTLVGATDD